MIELKSLATSDREQFIKDNQEAFNYGALEEFGRRDDHFEEEGEIISCDTIQKSIDNGEAYRIMQDGNPVGGVVIRVNGERGDLDLLFVSPKAHSKGMRYKKHSYIGLYRYIQMFVVSNGVDTKYFANTDRDLLYSLTFFWTDENNVRITKLKDFSVTFLARDHVNGWQSDWCEDAGFEYRL